VGVLLQELEMLEHRVVGRKIELARYFDALRPRFHAMELDAMVEHDLVAAGEAPEKIQVPPGAAVFAVRHCVEAQTLLLLDNGLDLKVFDLAQLRGCDFSLFVLGTRLLDRRAAQDRTDMVGAERRLAALHGGAPSCRRQTTEARRRISLFFSP